MIRSFFFLLLMKFFGGSLYCMMRCGCRFAVMYLQCVCMDMFLLTTDYQNMAFVS